MTRINNKDYRITDDPELLTRTSWVDARIAHRAVEKGKARGNRCRLWVRAQLQHQLYSLGCFTQQHCGKVIFVGLLVLSLCCVGLKTVSIETNVEKLWVQEGGRLQQELAYTRSTLGEGSGTTNEIIIQTPKQGHNILTQESLLLHQEAVEAATKVSINLYDKEWKLKDLCYATEFPYFELPIFEQMVQHIMPCMIISPLDCFWEGSKHLGPDTPIVIPYHGIHKWTSLDPMKLIDDVKKYLGDHFPPLLEEAFTKAGIGHGYQQKPCIDPYDTECPTTAPNYYSKQVPNFGAELTGGCAGFAEKYMKWEEALVVGGMQKNKTNFITSASALQTIVLLMGEKDMYDFHNSYYPSLDWTEEKAKEVLKAWQRKFTQEIDRLMNSKNKTADNVLPFATISMFDILESFSQISGVRVAIGYVLMIVYAIISLMKWSDAVQSQAGIGIAGVLLIALSVAAGLGICSVIGIKFNASTTQITPFLALGLGVDDMFLMAHTFSELGQKDFIPQMELTGECLKRTGVSILLTSISNMVAFFMAAIIPIPALRAFVLQAAILVIFNSVTILIVFPAVVSLDLIRREEKKVDIACCFTSSSANNVIELHPREASPPPGYDESSSPPPPYTNNQWVPPSSRQMHQTIAQTDSEGRNPPTTVLAPEHRRYPKNVVVPEGLPPSTASSQQCLTPEDPLTCKDRCAHAQQWNLTRFATHVYAPLLELTFVKIVVVLGFVSLLVAGIVGCTKVEDGLDLTDVVPRHTTEYAFLDAQSKYFGFYNFFAVTKEDFDYPNNQRLLFDYHKAYEKVHKIIKKQDGSLPEFWLQLMKQWLLDMQNSFDEDLEKGNLDETGWTRNASADGVLGYQLMLQTGDPDSPTDKDRIKSGRLVDKEGIMYPPAFYNYLTAWASNDALAYAASGADIYPMPKHWVFDPQGGAESIVKSQPIQYAQLAFYLNDISGNGDMIETVKKVRNICETFSAKGLPNYPSGIPFTFWEQYLNLRFYLAMALISVIGGIFLVLSLVLMNVWAATIVVVVLSMMVVELFGFMGLYGIKLSAVPAVILIVAVGIGVEFTVHIVLGFLTSIGSRNKRMKMTLEHMFAPVVHGAVSTLLGVIMLLGAEFDFIVKYFFVVLTTLVFLGVLNGLVLLPVLLSIVGPSAEVIPEDDGDCIPPPTPEPSPPPPPRHTSHRAPRNPRYHSRMPSDLSLSTITEEPTQYSSHEIIVQPEVVVETRIGGGEGSGGYTNVVHTNSSNNRNGSPPSSNTSTPPTQHVTKVKATATVSVQIHTPLPGAVDQEHSYKSKRRKHREPEPTPYFSDSDTKSSDQST